MSGEEFDFDGVQEAPLPDLFEDDMAADQGVAPSPPVRQSEPVSPPEGVGQPIQQTPNAPRPQRPNVNYDAASSSGARPVRTQQMHQGYSQPGQSVDGGAPAGAPPQQRVPQQPAQGGQPAQRKQRPPLPGSSPQAWRQQNQQGQPQQGQVPGQQMPMGGQQMPMNGQQMPMGGQQMPMGGQPMPPQKKGKLPFGKKAKGQPNAGMPQGMGPSGPNVPNGPNMPNNPNMQRPKKKLPIIPIVIGVVVLLVIVFVATRFIGKKDPLVPQVQNYELSGRKALDSLVSALNAYNPENMDAIVGMEDGDSYLAQEWAYVNNVKIRQEFLQTVGALVKFQYPKVQQMSTTGVPMTDDAGNPVMVDSYMNDGEEITVTIPDYYKLTKTMDEKADYILQMLDSAKYDPLDYTWPDELTNLMLQFVLDDGEIPTKEVQLQLTIRMNTAGQPYIVDDAPLDDLLFGSEDFRGMAAKFSQICVGWTGKIEEVYLEYERKHNDEYDRWLELFLAYFEADGGIYDPNADPQFSHVRESFNSRTSKWEPWYLRDANNVIQTYPDGTYIVNYFSVKDENGNDWIQPAAEIEYEVEKIRYLDDPWEEETGIWYNWLGCHWLQTEYNGKGSIVFRVGDGSREHPAGIGTTIITKVKGTDGRYHDVKVALMGYWTGQNAIDYAEKFSARNRGFTVSSVVQLICFEVYVENLELEPFSFESSEMTLTDRNSNISSRTGTMYDFTDIVYLEGREVKDKSNITILNDWATSTELNQKYACWGKSFGRNFSMVYFDCLAGTGDIPSYSAYAQFTGKSLIEE